MKINKIHVNAFGKLTNFELTLNDGFNLIYGDNEFGKTTLMAFIKMIFFGTASGKAGLDRKKYIPWNGGKYAGSIEFTKDGVPYRIEREFAATNSHDKIKMINLMNSSVMEVSPKENLGEKLFGCSLACFERTLFIGALGDSDTENTVLGEINKKLANIVTSGDEDVNAATVSKNLLDARHHLLSKGGKIGVCDKAKIRADELQNTLLNERLEYAEKEQRILEINEIKAQIEAVNAREAALKCELQNAQSLSKAAALKEFVSCSAQVENLKQNLTCKDGSILTQKDIFTINDKKAQLDAAKMTLEQRNNFAGNDIVFMDSGDDNGKVKSLEETAENLKTEINNKEKLAEYLSKKTGTKISPVAVILLVLAILAAALGVVLKNVLSIPLYALGAAFLIGFVIVLIISAKKSKAAQSNYMALREEILKTRQTLQEITNEISVINEANSRQAELKLFAIKQKENEIAELKEGLKTLEENYQRFLNTLPDVHGFDDDEKIRQLSNLLIELSTAQSKAQVLSDSLGGITPEQAQRALAEMGDTLKASGSVQELEREINHLHTKSQQLLEEYHRQENLVSIKYHHLHIPATLEREITELQEEISRQEEFCTALDLALEVLEEAADEMQSSWGGELNDRVSEIFSQITGEKYSNVLVSKALSLSAEEKGSFGQKSIEALSAGTKDQAYFALRLALCELIFGKNNSFPIFLDDSFERYDDLRAKRVLSFLKEFSSKNQVLLFTCHKNFEELV